MDGFNRFIFNRSLSRSIDTIMLAENLNKMTCLTDEQLYHTAHFSIKPKKKRFSKWIKPSDDGNVDSDKLIEFMRINRCSKRDALNELE